MLTPSVPRFLLTWTGTGRWEKQHVHTFGRGHVNHKGNSLLWPMYLIHMHLSAHLIGRKITVWHARRCRYWTFQTRSLFGPIFRNKTLVRNIKQLDWKKSREREIRRNGNNPASRTSKKTTAKHHKLSNSGRCAGQFHVDCYDKFDPVTDESAIEGHIKRNSALPRFDNWTIQSRQNACRWAWKRTNKRINSEPE